MILRMRVGWETLVIGPRADFSGLLDGNPSTGDPLTSEYEIRRCLLIALYDPAISEQLRRAIGHWTGDAYRVQTLSDRALIDRIAYMARSGMLIAFVVPEPTMKARVSDIGAKEAQPLATGAPSPTIASMPLEQRIKETLLLVPDHLTGAARDEFMALIAPEAIAITVGVLAIWAASHFIGVGEIVDAILIVSAYLSAGPAVWEAAKKLRLALSLISGANSRNDLEAAAKLIAEMVSAIGVGAFAAAITRGAGKRAAKWKAKKPSVRKPPEEKAPKQQKLETKPEAPPKPTKVNYRDNPRFDELRKDPQSKKPNVKSEREAEAILQAEQEYPEIKNARRPDLSKGEPNIDFKTDDGWIDVKSAEPRPQRTLAQQAQDIADKSKLYDPDVKLLVDINNVPASERAAFIKTLTEAGADMAKIRFVPR